MPLAKGRPPKPRTRALQRPKQYTAMHRVADAAHPKLKAAVREGLRAVAEKHVTTKDLMAGLATGSVGEAVHAIQWAGLENDLFARFQPVLLATAVHAAHSLAAAPVAKAIPPVQATLGASFDQTNARAVQWARVYAANLALNLAAEAQQAVRSIVVQMFEDGIPPQEAARRIRAMIGLDRRYSAAVLNYQARLLANKVPIPPETVTKLVSRYSDRLLAQRAETIARTEAIRASVTGQQLLWQDQIDRGVLSPDRIRQVWLVTPDESLCPVCASIPSKDNQPPVGGLFDVPETGEQVTGPPMHPNCRCDVALLVASPDGTFPTPPSLLQEIDAYAGADGPPPARVLQPPIPVAYR